MNVSVENLGPCRRLVRVEVEAEAVEAAFKHMTADFQKEVKLPGFRPGKAPADLVSRNFARQIEEEAKRKLISDNYRDAIKSQNLRVVGKVDVEEIQFERGQPLQFAATVEVIPDFEIPEYRGIPIKLEKREVTDEDVAKALEVLREKQASYKDVERPVQNGDFVVVNYTGTSEGKPLTEFAPTALGLTKNQNFWIHVAPGSFIPGFTEQLVGAKAGEHRTVTLRFPEDFVAQQLSGKEGVYEVDVVEVKEKVLPELTEEFAKSYGAESLEKLREGVRKDLQNELTFKRRRTIRNELVQSLLNRVQVDLPESVVMAETRNVVWDIVRENQERGVSKELIDQQSSEIFNLASSSAKDKVKARFILGRIAEKENITVSQEEMLNQVMLIAQQNNVKLPKLVKQLNERKALPQIEDQIRVTKVLAFLEKNARIDES